METNYISRDTYGMYKNIGAGPGPALMGAGHADWQRCLQHGQ